MLEAVATRASSVWQSTHCLRQCFVRHPMLTDTCWLAQHMAGCPIASRIMPIRAYMCRTGHSMVVRHGPLCLPISKISHGAIEACTLRRMCPRRRLHVSPAANFRHPQLSPSARLRSAKLGGMDDVVDEADSLPSELPLSDEDVGGTEAAATTVAPMVVPVALAQAPAVGLAIDRGIFHELGPRYAACRRRCFPRDPLGPFGPRLWGKPRTRPRSAMQAAPGVGSKRAIADGCAACRGEGLAASKRKP